MDRVPQILGFGEIGRVSYYQWLHLKQCPLKGAIAVLKLDGPLPEQVPTRAELVGRFHHRAMELTVNTQSPTELVGQIDADIVLLQATVDRWAHLRRLGSVSGWDEVNRSAALAMRIASTPSAMDLARVRHTERELKSKDARLVGRPDYFSIAGNDVLLREYKSGSIREPSGSLVRAYVDQLTFYSHLIFDNFEVKRVVCRLESLTGDEQEVTIERQQAGEFAAEVLQLVDHVNAELLAIQDPSDLACPSKDACSSCRARIVCTRFRSEQQRLGLEDAQLVVEGTVKSISEHATVVVADVLVIDEGRKTINTLTMPKQECDDITVDARFVFMNLRRHGGALAWDHTSRILRCD